MISRLLPVVGLGWRRTLVFELLARFMYDAIISTVMARSRRDLGESRLWLVENLWWVIFARLISIS
jgi:hypothetical protein